MVYLETGWSRIYYKYLWRNTVKESKLSQNREIGTKIGSHSEPL